MMPRPRENKTISFRLASHRVTELHREAKALGVSPGELCRAVVERHLKRDDTRVILEAIEALGQRQEALAQALDQALTRLDDELSGLREDFNRALRA